MHRYEMLIIVNYHRKQEWRRHKNIKMLSRTEHTWNKSWKYFGISQKTWSIRKIQYLHYNWQQLTTHNKIYKSLVSFSILSYSYIVTKNIQNRKDWKQQNMPSTEKEFPHLNLSVKNLQFHLQIGVSQSISTLLIAFEGFDSIISM